VVIVVVGDCDVVLDCLVTLVVVWGAGFVLLVVLSQKHDVRDRVSSIKVPIPIKGVVFMGQHYPPEVSHATCGNA